MANTIEGDIRIAVYPKHIAHECFHNGKWTAFAIYERELNMKPGDRFIVHVPNSYTSWEGKEVELVKHEYANVWTIRDVLSGKTSTAATKYLQPIGNLKANITVVSPKLGWQDQSDSSRFENVRPGIHAVCSYASDGSSWEWGVLTKQTGAEFVGQGRSVDRRTAKSDAEFFIANYQPEDTTERDEMRRKLKRSWNGT